MLLDERFNAVFAEFSENCVDCIEKLLVALGYADCVGFLGGNVCFAFAALVVESCTFVIRGFFNDEGSGKLVNDNNVNVNADG